MIWDPEQQLGNHVIKYPTLYNLLDKIKLSVKDDPKQYMQWQSINISW